LNAYNQPLPAHAGRTNFLLLGVSGGNHDGPELTDTIIFVSVGQEKGDVVMVTIPRDIWVNSMKAKINTAYYYGEQKKTGGGFILAKSTVSEIIDQPVHYVAMINFANFEKVIDSIGGVDIVVDRTFDDFKYPIPGLENDDCNGDTEYMCRYEHLHFDSGLRHMDGKSALKYVRSRYAEGEEGSDFARSKRQEKLLLAIKDKLMSAGVLSDPVKLKNLYTSLSNSITSDVDSSTIPSLAKLGIKTAKANTIRSAALIDPDHLYNPRPAAIYGNQWVLLPRGNDPKVIFNFVAGELSR
jgi:LCP family protein required for cell wall assembly